MQQRQLQAILWERERQSTLRDLQSQAARQAQYLDSPAHKNGISEIDTVRNLAIIIPELFIELPESINIITKHTELPESINIITKHTNATSQVIHEVISAVSPSEITALALATIIAVQAKAEAEKEILRRKQSTKDNVSSIANMVNKLLSNKTSTQDTPTQKNDNKDNKKVDNDSLSTEVDNALAEVGNLGQIIVSNPISNLLFAAEPEATETAQKALSSPESAVPAQVPKAAPKAVSKPPLNISHNPQAGSYLANQMAAQQMFITDNLQHRQRETRYIDPITGKEKVSSMWLNTTGAKSRFNSGNGQLQTKSHRYAIQLGGTLNEWSSGGDDKGILGITAGLGKSTSHSHSTSSQHKSDGSVNGYNLGLYSIWYADNQTQLGPYIDLLAQYGWFHNQVKAPAGITGANYKSYVFTTALESGYKFQLLEKADARLFIQPKAKVSWQRMSGVQDKGSAGAQVILEENNVVATQLGMRTSLELDIDTLSSNRTLQLSPSFEANWIHNGNNKGVWLESTNITPQGNNNIADLKLGIEANIDSNLQLWTHLGHQFGGHNYSDTQAMLGANYRF
ncbi:autotransporter outer membrane beta-barrel domain-containing protein [Yersinia enterocolitica]|nr:autotransporter outer membrane beta-barrel domain-containing protein [Yersinia enterocolitica]